jgi:hypothetical protein
VRHEILNEILNEILKFLGSDPFIGLLVCLAGIVVLMAIGFMVWGTIMTLVTEYRYWREERKEKLVKRMGL